MGDQNFKWKKRVEEKKKLIRLNQVGGGGGGYGNF
jgi:hypothetical protein